MSVCLSSLVLSCLFLSVCLSVCLYWKLIERGTCPLLLYSVKLIARSAIVLKCICLVSSGLDYSHSGKVLNSMSPTTAFVLHLASGHRILIFWQLSLYGCQELRSHSYASLPSGSHSLDRSSVKSQSHFGGKGKLLCVREKGSLGVVCVQRWKAGGKHGHEK